MKVTSVAGHVMHLEFEESKRKWTSCPIEDLFFAQTFRSID